MYTNKDEQELNTILLSITTLTLYPYSEGFARISTNILLIVLMFYMQY